MPVKAISATVDEDIIEQFEQVYRHAGMKKSHAIEEAIKLWLKTRDEALMAQGCRLDHEDDLAFAKTSKKRAAKLLTKE